MDDEEYQAMLMQERQLFRWAQEYTAEFWQRPEELEITHEIERLKKLSASYQRKYGAPPIYPS